MKLKFTCPTCHKRFRDDPGDLNYVICPNCESRLMVPEELLDLMGQTEAAPGKKREGGWIVAAIGGFVLVWGLIVLALWLRSRPSTTVVVAPPPAPPPVVVPPPVQTSAPVVAAPTPIPTSVSTTQPEQRVIRMRLGQVPEPLHPEQIDAAVRKGVDYLLSNLADGEFRDPSIPSETLQNGINALAVYALLHTSQQISDPRINISGDGMKRMLQKMKSHPMNATASTGEPITYSRALRACALSVYNRSDDKEALHRDVQWLLRAMHRGGYVYDDIFERPEPLPRPGSRDAARPTAPPGAHGPTAFTPDNSNSQYGLFGVWTAAESGVAVPDSYWEAVENYWATGQGTEGTWGYHPGQSGSYAMTLAAITSLSVVRDYLPASNDPARARAATILDNALAWFQGPKNQFEDLPAGGYWGYNLYGLERTILATGIMYAGDRDIYRTMAAKILTEQNKDGSFHAGNLHDGMINTSFALLFLSRGQHPVMFSKLKYPGPWDLRARDLSLLTRYASHAMERPVNWQVANLSSDYRQWLDSPILYISGSQPFNLTDEELGKLRQYAIHGGLIFTHSDLGSRLFTDFAEKLAAKLFPEYPMADVPPEDDLYKMVFPIDPKTRPMKVVSNGARRLMIHSSSDLAGGWISRQPRERQSAGNMAINLLVYASGRGPLKSRVQSLHINPPGADPVHQVTVARLKYSGNWNPEPAAWPRLSNRLAWELGWGVKVEDLSTSGIHPITTPLVVLSGINAPTLASAEKDDLKRYVEGGGVLLIDPCGGKPGTLSTIQNELLKNIFPGATLKTIPESHPILTGVFKDLNEKLAPLPKPTLRPYSTQVARPATTQLLQFSVGKGEVLLCPVDLTTGLLGTQTWDVNGYAPAYAEQLAKNIVTWAATR